MSLIDVLQDKYGKEFHPALLLAEVVQDESKDIRLRVDCAKTLMPYIAPSLKAVQVRGHISHDTGLLRIEDYGTDDDIVVNDETDSLLIEQYEV